MRFNASRKAALAVTAASLAIFLADPAFAQTKTAADDTAATDNSDSIVVIGTRRTDRSVTNSPSPVDVVGADELNAQPAGNMLDVVKNIVPSFFVGQNSISDASTFVRAPSLRGLPADEILVMLNGKRYNRSALVQVYTGGDTALSFGSQGSDISAIPSIAIKNLQVLRDGATAQYGSDAIGGVLNYGLREDAGVELQARYGQQYDKGDGKSYQIAGDVGVKLGDRGFVNLAAEYNDDGQTSRGTDRAIAKVFAANNPGLASQLPGAPGPQQIWGSSPSHGYKVLLNSALEVSDNSKLYLFVNVAHSRANESFNYRASQSVPSPLTVDQGTGSPSTRSPGKNGSFNNIFLTKCPVGSTGCTPGTDFVFDSNTYNFATLYPAGFTPRFVGVTDEAYGTLGYKGSSASGFTYDLSGSLSRNTLDLSMYNSLNASFGPTSQTAFHFGKLIQKEIDGNLDLTYPVDAGFFSPLTLSGGLEYRKETYQQTAGDTQSYAAGPYAVQPLYSQTGPTTYTALLTTNPLCPTFNALASPTSVCTVSKSPGASGYGGTSPASAGSFSQNSYGAYLGLEGDLTKTFSMGIAARYEHYNSFGSAFVTKLNGIWHVTDTFALRGTVGTGFHAPSPGQNNDEILTTNFVAGNQVQTGTYPVTSAIAQYYGAVSLKPEKSTNYGAGFVFNPTNVLSLTVDWYSIKVTNRIGVSQNFNVTAADLLAQPALAAVGVGGAVNYFTNGFSTRTQGVDVVGSYRSDLGGGKLNLTLAYSYNISKVLPGYNTAVISPAQIYDIGHLAPRHRINFNANWQSNGFALNFAERYYSSWGDANDYPVNNATNTGTNFGVGQTFKSKFVTDLDVSYTFADHYTLSVGANNLFNTYPDKIAPSIANPIYALTGGTADGQIYPRSGGPFGINGGLWYVRVKVKY